MPKPTDAERIKAMAEALDVSIGDFEAGCDRFRRGSFMQHDMTAVENLIENVRLAKANREFLEWADTLPRSQINALSQQNETWEMAAVRRGPGRWT